MKHYAIYCDFSTLKCDATQFYDYLDRNFESVDNLDRRLWLVDYDNKNPFTTAPEEIRNELVSAGYADKDFDICIMEISSVECHFRGIHKAFIANP